MPEGPSIVILRGEAQRFVGRRILRVDGNSKQDIARLRHRVVRDVRSWGKHFLIDCGALSVRIHFGLFGSWCVDAAKPRPPRLGLGFSRGGALNFYACSVRLLEAPLDELYDWTLDVMSPSWDAAAARARLRRQPDTLVADALLDQTLFAGVGNIIKNEVLHRIRVHPESRIGALPARKLGDLVREARDYSFDFYRWKQAFELRKHWQVHAKTTCPRDGDRLAYRKHLGRARRRAFYCERCQRLYD